MRKSLLWPVEGACFRIGADECLFGSNPQTAGQRAAEHRSGGRQRSEDPAAEAAQSGGSTAPRGAAADGGGGAGGGGPGDQVGPCAVAETGSGGGGATGTVTGSEGVTGGVLATTNGLVAYSRSTLLELESWLLYQWLARDCPLMSEGFRARDIGLRAQKKILSRMANKNVAKVFIDDTTASLLDNVYKLAKAYTGNKKEAEKLVKNIIKVVIKLGVLYRNSQFSKDELSQAERFKNRFHAAAMAVVSFYEVDFSYDRVYLLTALGDARAALRSLVQRHLTGKSMARIDSVFDFFANAPFLDAVFRKDSEHRELLGRIVADMNRAMDEGGM